MTSATRSPLARSLDALRQAAQTAQTFATTKQRSLFLPNGKRQAADTPEQPDPAAAADPSAAQPQPDLTTQVADLRQQLAALSGQQAATVKELEAERRKSADLHEQNQQLQKQVQDRDQQLQATEQQVQELTRQQQVHTEQLQQAQVQQLQQQIVELERTMARREDSDRKSRGSNLTVSIPLAGRTAAPTREQVRDTLVQVTGVASNMVVVMPFPPKAGASKARYKLAFGSTQQRRLVLSRQHKLARAPRKWTVDIDCTPQQVESRTSQSDLWDQCKAAGAGFLIWKGDELWVDGEPVAAWQERQHQQQQSMEVEQEQPPTSPQRQTATGQRTPPEERGVPPPPQQQQQQQDTNQEAGRRGGRGGRSGLTTANQPTTAAAGRGRGRGAGRGGGHDGQVPP
jgi:ribosomal protein S24E